MRFEWVAMPRSETKYRVPSPFWHVPFFLWNWTLNWFWMSLARYGLHLITCLKEQRALLDWLAECIGVFGLLTPATLVRLRCDWSCYLDRTNGFRFAICCRAYVLLQRDLNVYCVTLQRQVTLHLPWIEFFPQTFCAPPVMHRTLSPNAGESRL